MPCNIILGTETENLVNFTTSCTPPGSGNFSFTLVAETQFQDTFEISGTDTEGDPVSEELTFSKIDVRDYDNEVAGDVNPAKVFKKVAKVLKSILCPSCM